MAVPNHGQPTEAGIAFSQSSLFRLYQVLGDRMDWSNLRQTYMSTLTDMGFRPEIDGDGDIRFMYEGGNYYITDNCDDTYFFIMYPGFWTLEDRSEQLAGLIAANTTNTQVKAATILLSKDTTTAAVTVECLIRDPSDVSSILMRALRCIQLARKTFKDEIEGLTANS
jgi:hypothetical protein